jgi:diaminohydroxyphosphoribosylaminopyrimidine deaminase/5-amino-6-(5-phosphoribosylamino)uracil reductase
MRRALELADRGRTTVSPNPMVGCVVAVDTEIVAEGFHERAGGPHAEIVALRMAGSRARGATLYVTLEPCAHTGRTGPCTDAIIEAGVAEVVVATPDPNPPAAGGADVLRSAGVNVAIGLLEQEAKRQNEVFLHGVATGRPFVVAKAAISLDGRIAAADGTSQWLTGGATRLRVHTLRAEVDAVLVGSGTVIADDPHLTCRLDGYAGDQPLRVVLDRRGRVTADHRVCDNAAPTEVIKRYDDLGEILRGLWQREVRSILVEGGASVLHAFLAADLVDRLHVHVAPVLLGDAGRPLLAGPWANTLEDAPRFSLDAVEQLDDDALLELRPRRVGTGTLAASAQEES